MSSIPVLEGFDARTASGILARAALDVASRGLNPASQPQVPHENEIRADLIDYAQRDLLRQRPETDREALLQWLDELAESVAEPVDEAAAIERLSLEALLPSDAYEIKFGKSTEFDQVAALDQDRAVEAVKQPDFQEDFVPSPQLAGPRTTSLFGKWYRSFTFEDMFLLVVIGSREKKQLNVTHSWRLYPSDLHFRSVPSLMKLMERFADFYGEDFQVGDFEGKFLYFHRYKGDPSRLELGQPKNLQDPSILSLTHGPSDDPAYSEVSFGMCINLRRYGNDVFRHMKRERSRSGS